MATEAGKSIPGNKERLEKMLESARPKLEVLAEKMQTAAGRGDMGEVQRLQKELEAIQAPLSLENPSSETTVEKVFELPKDFDCRYEIRINSDIEGEIQNCRKEAPIGEIPVFWATDDQPKTIEHPFEGVLYAYLGPVECKLKGNAFGGDSQEKNENSSSGDGIYHGNGGRNLQTGVPSHESHRLV
ncbi:MAG: hypothetical protein WA705_15170 [Candidatus Ozemobacteraceae bacterium]